MTQESESLVEVTGSTARNVCFTGGNGKFIQKKNYTSLIEGYTADFLEKKAEQGQQHICRTASDAHVMVPEIPNAQIQQNWV